MNAKAQEFSSDASPDTSVEASVAYLAQVLGVDAFMVPPNFDPTAPVEGLEFTAGENDGSLVEQANESEFVVETVARTETEAVPEVGAEIAAIEEAKRENQSPAHEADVAFSGSPEANLAFVVFEEKSATDAWTPERSELLSRMVTAMKQNPDVVLRLSFSRGSGDAAWQALQSRGHKAVVVLGEAAGRELLAQDMPLGTWLEDDNGTPFMVTRSLQDILDDPNIKRIVWQHLQMVMKKL